MGQQNFTSNGTFNWPEAVTTVVAEAIGGGGAGGAATGNPSRGGGGKAGGYAKKTITKGAESSLTINVGTAGAGGGGAGGNGNPSEVVQNGTTVLRASGGNGAAAATTSGANSAGATTANGTAVGDTTTTGGNGGTSTGTNSGAGGGSGGPTSAGGDASVSTAGTSGTGNFVDGVNYSSAGAAGVAGGTAGSAAPSSGTDYGGAGSGGNASANPDRNGGSGRQGIVVLTWTDPPVYEADQDAFRWYEDGTESGATATQTQGTDDTIDTGGGDIVRVLRTRIQETNGGVGGDATDDYQLYVDKNAAGSYKPLGLIDGQLVQTTGFRTTLSTIFGHGQSITGNGKTLDRVKVILKKIGSITGNVEIRVYAHSGTFGTSSVGTGSALATSSTIDTATITSTATEYTFTFTGGNLITLANGTNYMILVFHSGGGSIGNSLQIMAGSGLGHPGNRAQFSSGSAWTADSTEDIVFKAESDQMEIMPFASSNVAEGDATTNRLTGGSGSFVAGKVTEDGEVNDMDLTGNNFTELVAYIKVISAQVANGDFFDFKWYRNSAPIDTYTDIPRLTISTSAPAGQPTWKRFGGVPYMGGNPNSGISSW